MTVDNVDYAYKADKSNTAPGTGVTGGSGGGDMGIWGEGRQTRLNTLISRDWSNESAYTLASGIVESRVDGYATEFYNNERANDASPTDVEGGGGGGDMDIWGAGRVTRLQTLLSRDWENQSAYTFASGIVESRVDGYPTDFHNNERANDASPLGVEDGTGGGDMDIWGAGRVTRLQTLISRDWGNQSAYTLSSGVVESRVDGYPTDFHNNERANDASPLGVEDGGGGGDMDIWEADRVTRLQSLVNRNWENLSVYTLSAGIVESRVDGYPTDFHTNEKDNSLTPVDVEDGIGGGNMDLWSKGRKDMLTSAVKHTYENEAKFLLPSGLVSMFDGYSTQIGTHEKGQAIAVTGSAVDADGNPMSGSAEIRSGDEVITSKAVVGAFVLSSPPPGGVASGGEGEGVEYDFHFVPDIDAINYVIRGLFAGQDIGKFQYGAVEGTVTDYEGQGVEGERVQAPGAATKTGPQGRYSLEGPGGTTVNLESLKGFFTKEATLTGGSATTVNFQYSGLDAKVEMPNGVSMENVAVETDLKTETKFTDKDGKARFNRIPPEVSGHVIFGEDISVKFDTGREGILKTVKRTVGVGFTGTVINADTKNPVKDVDITFQEADVAFRSHSGSQGEYFIGADKTGEITLVISHADKRYEPATLHRILEEGDTVEYDFELVPARETGTFG